MTVVTYKNVKRPIINPGDLPMLALFARGEQGAWYDPSDLYNYMERGPELVPADPVWDLSYNPTAIVSGQRVEILDQGNVITTIGSANGRSYEVSFDVVQTGPSILQVFVGGIVGPIRFNADTPVGRVTGIKIMTSGSRAGEILFGGQNAGWIIDNISVRELTGIGRATMFQDAEGTIPVTGVEQPVGLILDKSGNGNHASQVTTTARPMLSARVNRIENTYDFNSSPWSRNSVTLVGGYPAPDGTLTAHRMIEGTTTAFFRVFASTNHIPVTTGETFTRSIYAKAGSRGHLRITGSLAVLGAAVSASYDLHSGTAEVRGAGEIAMTHVGDGWYRCSLAMTVTGTGTGAVFEVMHLDPQDGNSITYQGDGEGYIYIWGAQVESGSVATRHQRSTSATDYDWRGWPLYLRFDGVDDMLLSSSPNPDGAAQVTAAAAVQKMSDTLRGAVLTVGNNAQRSFALSAPGYDNQPNYAAWVAAEGLLTVTRDGYPAPHTAVLTLQGDISSHAGAGTRFRVNGDESFTAWSTPPDSSISNTHPLALGAFSNGTRFFPGSIYGAVVRMTTSTPDEILAIEKSHNDKIKVPE